MCFFELDFAATYSRGDLSRFIRGVAWWFVGTSGEFNIPAGQSHQGIKGPLGKVGEFTAPSGTSPKQVEEYTISDVGRSDELDCEGCEWRLGRA